MGPTGSKRYGCWAPGLWHLARNYTMEPSFLGSSSDLCLSQILLSVRDGSFVLNDFYPKLCPSAVDSCSCCREASTAEAWSSLCR